MEILSKNQRDVIALSLAKLSIERPGWYPGCLQPLAITLGILDQFEAFRRIHETGASEEPPPSGFVSICDSVVLTMTRDDYNALLINLGIAAGHLSGEPDKTRFYSSRALVNRLNAGNPDFRPYEVPEEYR